MAKTLEQLEVAFEELKKELEQKREITYPPDLDFKRSVELVLDGLLREKIHDTLWRKTFRFMTLFESLDGWGTTVINSSTVVAASDMVTLTTDTATNDSAKLFKNTDIQGLISFSQRSRFRTRIELSSVADQLVYITIGNIQGGAQGYGFKIADAVLSGVTDDGTTESLVTLITLQANKEYSLDARYEPGRGVVFLVDDPTSTPAAPLDEQGSLSTNIPDTAITPNDYPFDFYIRTDTTAAKVLRVSFTEYLQEINTR